MKNGKESKENFKEILTEKNKLIINQTRRINYLEEKLMETRQKYFRLKHDEDDNGIHVNHLC